MEEDPELITTFQRHLARQYGDKWNSLNSKQQALKIKNAMMKYRVPTSQSNRKGGKRTKRRLKKRGKSRKIRKSRKKERR